MITETKKGGQNLSDAVAYAVYCISAKDHPEAKPNERVLLVQSENLLLPPPPAASNLKACRAWGQLAGIKIEEWTKDKRSGRPMPKSLFQSGSISFSEADSKKLSPAQALEIAREAVCEVMPGDRAILWSVHGDTNCLHVHFEASSTDDTGTVWNPRFDFRFWESSMERLEIKYGLERVTQRKVMAKQDHVREIKICAPSRAELEIAAKDGTPSPKALALSVLNQFKGQATTITEFFDAVETVDGYEIVPNGMTGKCSGYSLRCPDGVQIKGSDFGKAYSFVGLQKGGISYEQDRDFEAISRRRRREASRTFASGHDTFDNLSTPCPASGCNSGSITPSIERNSASRAEVCFSSTTSRASHPANVGQAPRSCNNAERNGAGSESTFDQGASNFGGDRGDTISSDHDRLNTGFAIGKAKSRETGGRNRQGSSTPTTAIDRQILAWDRQCRALGLSDDAEIRMMLIDRDEDRYTASNENGASGMPHPEPFGGYAGWQRKKWREKNGGEVFWTVDQVRKAIKTGRFAALNSLKYDIFMRPYESDFHYLFIDDTTPEILATAGYTPCLIQESSPGNYQCILKIPRNQHPPGSDAENLENRAINALALSLNTRFGDRKAGRIDQVFRLSGFANKKPIRNDFFTKIAWGSCKVGHICNAATAELDDFRSAVKISPVSYVKTDPEDMQKTMPMIEPEQVQAHAAFNRLNRHSASFLAHDTPNDLQEMAREIRKWSKTQGRHKVPDWSEVDFLACRELAKKGWNTERLENALYATSPELHDRKRGHESDYIRRTVTAAMNALKKGKAPTPTLEPSLQHSQFGIGGPTI
ncbi:relaxase/mobilization nuclease domain-containing protein [Dechloromonas sp. HYN0024]|uniref:relaxase/mobilization nuclease domain-containing protein n=1 Tax=Dechloromonas sp. HYN0024 TaxID=2231055 RepID=UPI000E452EFB|nr:DNA-primase RepB domain-containing protein [Dechloromonas sp. HYN0024]AXS79832.1 hypothetical protein HYN24_07270 [Dechloromonas sp. HYN0024]